ncbi:Fic family protein [Desulfobulbus elongatus]|uniref:Fic family protein n=1 Tax=Desulfobulbus elongatus TaxID=53332 RepID=UPI000A804192|nr:Fic family protein [Desulfobulbus elongatus]
MTFTPTFTITNRMTQAITRIERARGFLEAAQLSADWVREVGEQALILEAHHSTHIEGTRLTLDQAERLWRGEAVPEADPDEARELLNYRTAFEFISECLDSGDPITLGMVREIHRKLVEGVRSGSAAPREYRRIQNYVVNSGTGQVICTPPTAVEVPVMMSELVQWLNADLDVHPVLVSGIAHFQLVHIPRFWMAMAAHRDYFPPSACTRQGMTSSGCSPSANITTVTGQPFTGRSRACATRTWT